jgi:putative membrane protein
MKENISPIFGAIVLFGCFGFLAFSKIHDPFYNKASQANLAEIKAGKLAQQKGSDKIKQVATVMVTDHTRAENDLKSLAKTQNLDLDLSPDADHQQAIAAMATLSGAAFDSTYMSSQLKDHQDAVALFSAEAENGPDAQAKTYAGKYLPKLNMHLEMFKGRDSFMKMSIDSVRK